MAKGKRKKTKQQPGRAKWFLLAFLSVALLSFSGGIWVALEKAPELRELQALLGREPEPVTMKPAPQPKETPVSSEPAPVERPAPQRSEPEQVEPKAPQDKPAPVAAKTPEKAPEPTPTPLATVPVKGQIAIVIDDCGNSSNDGFVALAEPITLAVLPHVPYADTVAARATAAGKCVILHLPMEAHGGSNPGPGALKTDMSGADLQAQIKKNFDAVPHIVGVNNHQGSKASEHQELMQLVLAETRSRNMFYLDSRTSSASLAPQTAASAQVPFLSRDVFLDNQDSVEAILEQLTLTEQVAARQGTAIAIGHPRANTLKALEQWLPAARARGFQFVLLTQLVRKEGHYAHTR